MLRRPANKLERRSWPRDGMSRITSFGEPGLHMASMIETELKRRNRNDFQLATDARKLERFPGL